MNYYVGLIGHVVAYIEENIQKPLSLDDLAHNFGFSAFHFNRMFSTVTGLTLKQYILVRKLSLALGRLERKVEPIFNIAYDYGFNSPEVFSRAFKKRFGVSPEAYRQERPRPKERLEGGLVERAVVVERDIASFQGMLSLQGRSIFAEEVTLCGEEVQVNTQSAGFEAILQGAGDEFMRKAANRSRLAMDTLYAWVNCMGEDDGNYMVYYGLVPDGSVNHPDLLSRRVPSGWYASFTYTGDMFDVRASFVNDLYRWVMVKEIELEANGVGMLIIFRSDYPESRQVEIRVPIRQPQPR